MNRHLVEPALSLPVNYDRERRAGYPIEFVGVPYRIRTGVAAVRGRHIGIAQLDLTLLSSTELD